MNLLKINDNIILKILRGCVKQSKAKEKRGIIMEVFILKLIGILCITTIAMTIIIARRNDTDIWAIVIATIFEILGLLIIYMPIDQIISIWQK